MDGWIGGYTYSSGEVFERFLCSLNDIVGIDRRYVRGFHQLWVFHQRQELGRYIDREDREDREDRSMNGTEGMMSSWFG